MQSHLATSLKAGIIVLAESPEGAALRFSFACDCSAPHPAP